ncbi:neuronal acetylcholine receptor subunit alpha-10-like isoform X2 [Planococcus citri]|uniref:neuronal acetylcholine receptor subunit alpha-10-like isoform X2 n=1 Tax=Planococcus citri TaxID=170843 RepID=UPI0031F8CF4B
MKRCCVRFRRENGIMTRPGIRNYFRASCFFTSTVFFLYTIGSHAENAEYRLTKHLLSEYIPSVRPSVNYSESLKVIFGVSLHHIIDVDEKNQILTTNCWLTQVWTDHQLKWNTSEFAGIKVIRIPYDKVWRPDTILYNNADAQYTSSVINTNVIVSHTGEVVWLSHGIYRSSCDIDVQYFPFDVQSCTLKWASWTYDGYQLDLIKQTEKGDVSNYKANGEFDLMGFDIEKHIVNYSCCSEPYPDITYIIRIRRRPMFYVFNLILPCILINCIALLVFYVPSESGEKVTLGISALLSMTVFLMTIRETLPPTEKTPLISMYYGVSICLVTFASGLSVVTLNIYHRGVRGTKVPNYLKTIVLDKLAKVLHLQLCSREDSNQDLMEQHFNHTKQHYQDRATSTHEWYTVDDDSNIHQTHANMAGVPSQEFANSPLPSTSKFPDENTYFYALHQVTQSIQRNEQRLTEHEKREITEHEWKQVSLVCDRFLLYVFLITTAVTTGVILSGSPYGPF